MFTRLVECFLTGMKRQWEADALLSFGAGVGMDFHRWK